MPVSLAWISGFVFLGDLVPPVEAVPVRFQCHAQEDSCVWILRWNGTIGLDSDGVCISVCVSSSIAVCYCWERELWMRRFSAFQIFQDPTAMMQQLLTTSRQLTLGAYKHETECMYSYIQHCFKKQNKKAFTSFESLLSSCLCVSPVGELEQRTKEKLEVAKKRTSQEIAELKDKLKASRENINHLKAEIRKLEEDGDHKEHWKKDKYAYGCNQLLKQFSVLLPSTRI